MNTNNAEGMGPDLLPIHPGEGWTIRYHQLFNIPPEHADNLGLGRPGYTVWAKFFHDTLLIVRNMERSIVLDVGWYPDSDPEGEFRLVVLPLRKELEGTPDFHDWENPLVELHTRSLDELLKAIHEIIQ